MWSQGNGTRSIPAKVGTKAAAHYVLDVPAGESRVVRLRLSAAQIARNRSDARSMRRSRRASPRPTSSTNGSHPIRLSPDEQPGSIARRSRGCCGASSSTTTTWTGGCEEHESPPVRRRQAPRRPELRLVPYVQRRRHLDARQVGVPVVCGVGPGVPHDRARAGRLRFCQGATPADAPRPVLPSERPDPGLRVELQRRESAGPRLGRPITSTSTRRTSGARDRAFLEKRRSRA